jgi:sugar lactone lactonase YvrE
MPISSTAAGRPFSGFLTPSPQNRGDALYRLSAMVADPFAMPPGAGGKAASVLCPLAGLLVWPSSVKALRMWIAGSNRQPIVGLALVVLATIWPVWAQAQRITLMPRITTVAGNGLAGHSGDGGPATLASIDPFLMTTDAFGNLYFSEPQGNFVRKVDTSGKISTVAGNGTRGDTECAGALMVPTNATLGSPLGLAVNGAGELFIGADGRICMVTPSGLIVGSAGIGPPGYSGDGGPSNSAQVNPFGVAVDGAGNIYFSDETNHVIRKIDLADRGTISTVAGNYALSCPSVQSGCPAPFGGDNEPATGAALNTPNGIAVDTSGNIYFADVGHSRIRKVDTHGIITTVAGNGTNGYSGDGGPATDAALNMWDTSFQSTIFSIALDDLGNLYIADGRNYRVRKVDTRGIITTFAGDGTQGFSGDDGPPKAAQITFPAGIAVDRDRNVYFGDGNRIRKVGKPTSVDFGQVEIGASLSLSVPLTINEALALASVQSTGDFAVQGNTCPTGAPLAAGTVCTVQIRFAPSQAGQRVFGLAVTDDAGNRFGFPLRGTGVGSTVSFSPGVLTTVAGIGPYIIEPNGGDGGPATSASLDGPRGIKFDGEGNLYIVEFGRCRIRKVDRDGKISTVAGNGTCGYSSDGGPATGTVLGDPWGLALDSAGNLLIADRDGSRIRQVDANGLIHAIVGNGEYAFSGDGDLANQARLWAPTDIAFDVEGALYIADAGNFRVRKIASTGVIRTVAGGGDLWGPIADGGPATSARFAEIDGINIDHVGNLYISDYYAQTVRKVDPQGTITTLAGTGVFAPSAVPDNVPAAKAPLAAPIGMVTDVQGNVYIASYLGRRISKVDPSGLLTDVAGNNQLVGPWGLALDHAGILHVSEDHGYVRKFDTAVSALSFSTTPPQYVGITSDPQVARITNKGNFPLNFSEFAWPQYFDPATVGNDCAVGVSVAPGASCNIGVTFTPQAPGDPITGTLLVFDSALNSPQSITLTGNAQAVPPPPQPPPPATVLQIWVDTGWGYYSLFSSTRNRLPWKIARIRVLFSQAITTGGPASLMGLPTTGLNGLGTAMLDWTFSPLTLGNFSASFANSGADALRDEFGTAVAPMSFNFRVLWGDVNDDGVVSAADMVVVNKARAHWDNPFANLNDDEVIDLQDVQIVRSRIGTQLP